MILRNFPFRLFSVSTPHSEPPQQLCISFCAPHRIIGIPEDRLSGFFADEIAEEFAAFLAAVTRRRVFALRQTRVDGWPIEEPARAYPGYHFQAPQGMKEIGPEQIDELLRSLQAMDRPLARSYVLALRLYHAAVDMMFAYPEFSYLFLVMSLEAIATAAYKGWQPSDEGEGRTELDQFLDSQYSGWRSLCDVSDPEKRTEVVKMLLTPAYFTMRKVRNFVHDNVPEAYWSEREDNAKSAHVRSVTYPSLNGRSEEKLDRSDLSIHEWERIDRDRLKETLGAIYKARSEFVHEGRAFPPRIAVGLGPWIAAKAAHDSSVAHRLSLQGRASRPSIPPLLTFERLVSYCMVEFLSKQGCGNRSADGGAEDA